MFVGKWKLSQSGVDVVFVCTCKFEVLRRTTRSPLVVVDHDRVLCGSHKTRLPLKKRRVVWDQDTVWVGLAVHSGSRERV